VKVLRAIDPAVDLAYCADFDLSTHSLVQTETEDRAFSPSDSLLQYGRVYALVVERPLIRPRSKVKPNDIVDLAWCAAIMFERFRPKNLDAARYYKPEEWKGQLPKPAHHLLTLDELTRAELGLLPLDVRRVVELAANKGARDGWKPGKNYYREKDTVHNTLDAVALGLTALGRLPFPRGRRAKSLPSLLV
jgi:hypothetical protein